MPLSSEPQSIRSRSEESVDGGAPPNVKVDAKFKKFSSGPNDENRIARDGFEINGGKDLEADVNATLGRTDHEVLAAQSLRR
jgi:hypothetical protein